MLKKSSDDPKVSSRDDGFFSHFSRGMMISTALGMGFLKPCFDLRIG